MKTVYTNSELPHIWAHQKQDHGRSSTMSFSDRTIYSYGRHFPIARHVTNKDGAPAVLFTTNSYSVTTAKHISFTRRAIPAGIPVFYTKHVNHTPRPDILEEYQAAVDCFMLDASKSRTRTGYLLTLAHEKHAAGNACAEFFGWKERLAPMPGLGEYQVRAAAQRAAAKIAKEKADLLQAMRFKKQLTEWLGFFPAYADPAFQYGRIIETEAGEQIETTQGARIPADHARKALPFVLAIIDAKKTWQENGHAIHLGNYRLNRIDEAGTLHIGCHRIQAQEVKRFAELLK